MLQIMEYVASNYFSVQLIVRSFAHSSIVFLYFTRKKVIVCENVNASSTRQAETLTHEMLHAYDMCTKNVDPNNCIHHACMEIRSSNLSGECHLIRDYTRPTTLSVRRRHVECVKERAKLSISSRPACVGRVDESIAAAWSSCYSDQTPFDVVP